MQVTKRDGSKENFNPEKINKVIEWACEGLSGVSASDVAMKADIQLYNNIKTKDIHEIVIRAAGDLISVEHPDYQHVAGRLALFNLVKEVHGHFDYPDLEELIKQNVKRGVYDPSILDWYTSEDMAALNKAIKHDRNWNFTYAGLQQLIDKYLVRNRVSGELYETPQFLYMCMAMCIFHNYPKEHRLELVARFYDAISTSKINLPTPIMGGLRTPLRQYASCTLIDIDDDLSSIFSSDHAIGLYTAQRSGIGGNAGRIRAIGSKIRHGEVEHTGAIPFLKKFEATVQCCTQNGIRGGSATIHYPFWHYEIEDILVLKNNKGTEENRVRKLDYSIQFCKLFYERYIRGETVTLFSPNDVPGLYDAFGTQDFDELYRKYERAPGIRKKKVDARELLLKYAAERIGTGRVYMMNADHVNTHSSFIDHIFMSNLCQEITLPTKPIYSIDDENGEIALCILSAINIGAIKDLSEMEELCELAIRALDALIDYQEYPVIAAELSTKRRRSLGIGFTNVAYYLAKHKVKYTDPEAAELMDEATEALQYWCLKAGVKMAKEKGACEYFHRTKYSPRRSANRYVQKGDGYLREARTDIRLGSSPRRDQGIWSSKLYVHGVHAIGKLFCCE